jgi:hypothetical protein
MRIAVTNFSAQLEDDVVIDALRAIGRQLRDDFGPIWRLRGELSLVPARGPVPDPELASGDGVIYLCDRPDGQDVGYHAANRLSIPYGYVFIELAAALGQEWSAVLSHEILEMLVDPDLTALVLGPDPRASSRTVAYYKEICDPLNASSYALDGVQVADFVTPSYYQLDTTRRTVFHGSNIPPFGRAPGGYVEYFDPAIGARRRAADRAAMRTLDLKERIAGEHRRATRHRAASLAQPPRPGLPTMPKRRRSR